jgi:DNA-binding XRE family transcriptional regulator
MDERRPPPIEYFPGLRDVPRALDMLEDAICGATQATIAKKHGLSESRVGHILSLTLRTLNKHAATTAGIPTPPIPTWFEARRDMLIWRERIAQMRELRETQGGFHKVADPRLWSVPEANFRSRLAALVRLARERKGWSQAQLAHAVGKDLASYIAQIERAFAAPSPYIFTLMIRELDLTIPEVLGLLEPLPETVELNQ